MSVIEANGNSIKVAVRIRANEKSTQSDYIQINETNIIFKDKKKKTSNNFTYEYVFDQLSTQEYVYGQAISNLVVKCLDGFNVTVFAYGHTGSGKTYTIGSSSTSEEEGIFPKLLRSLIEKKDNNFEIKMSLIEIYKDQVIDLLDLKKTKRTIQNYEVKDLTIMLVEDFSCLEVIKNRLLFRKVGKTSMNKVSSRSHLIFTIYLENKSNLKSSKFNVIDLAGSEKAGADYKNSDSSRLVFEEGSYINSSLMDLRLLTQKIASGGNVSYQANSLTKLLKDSLGGNSYSLLIACIDSRSTCYAQTFETLKFANMVKSIKNNPLKLNSPVLDSNIFLEELNLLRKFKEDYDKTLTQKKIYCDQGTSPIKFRNLDSSILVLDNNNCSIPTTARAIEDIPRSSGLDSIYATYTGESNLEVPRALTTKRKRFSRVGLVNKFNEKSLISFKFEFFNICFGQLNNYSQDMKQHQFKPLKKGASVVFRCCLFYSVKCSSQIRFNYLNKDDSIEMKINIMCNH